MDKLVVPEYYDYIGVFLTNKCFLNCHYCITEHGESGFKERRYQEMSTQEWIEGLNRLQTNLPITLQGGEPFLHHATWDILKLCRHKIDILTALPYDVKPKDFERINLDWNKRDAPYPTIRVSYHKGQHDFYTLVDRVAELSKIVSIGIYYLEPLYDEQLRYAEKAKIILKPKDYLSPHGTESFIRYPEAIDFKIHDVVSCRNTVVPIDPDGFIYRCHSDLYHGRIEKVFGHISTLECIPQSFLECHDFGTCSKCDVKIKNNHNQEYGYTSAEIWR